MTVQTLEPILRQHPLFHGIDEHHLDLITGCARNVRFQEGEYIFHAGAPADQFYLIRSGLVAVQCMIPNRGVTTVQTVGEGEVLGWSWLLEPHRLHFDARVQRDVHAFEFDGKCLRGKCDNDHDLGYELLRRFMQTVEERLEATRMQILDVYANHR